jgi:hypothetical protein
MKPLYLFHVICGVIVFTLCLTSYDIVQPLQKNLSGYYQGDNQERGGVDSSLSEQPHSIDAIVDAALRPSEQPGTIEAVVHADSKSSLALPSKSTRNLPMQPQAVSKSSSKLSSKSKSNRNLPAQPQVAFCLLIKDDNDILAEWVAYHYHVMNMRRLIVAVDPDSQTSPEEVLGLWKGWAEGANTDGLALHYTLWNDKDFMPEYFWKDKDYSKVNNFLGDSKMVDPGTNRVYSSWHGKSVLETMTQEEILADLTKVNNHRFRQRRFVSQCYAQLKREGRTWTAHIDTDEYIVVNPLLRQAATAATAVAADARPKGTGHANGKVPVPATPSAGSLARFLNAMYKKMEKDLPHTCLMMPTLRVGSKEDDDDKSLMVATDGQLVRREGNEEASTMTSRWRYEAFESLRWQYHCKFDDNANNSKPKSLVNVATIPTSHPILANQIAFSIHEPMVSKIGGPKNACQGNVRGFEPIWKRPLSVNHYLGSLERYMSRDDVRRTEKIYKEKAANSSELKDDGWIRTWLASFIQEHGVDKARTVLANLTILLPSSSS